MKNRYLLILTGILIALSIYDLTSAPITLTLPRQAHTAMITQNYLKSGFSLDGLYVNLRGNDKVMAVYEFPIYNFLTGILFHLFGENIFWGKLVSLAAAIISLWLLFGITKGLFGELFAVCTGIFFIFSPTAMLIRTSFQPDPLALMFLLFSLYYLFNRKTLKDFTMFCAALSLACLVKFPIIIPYLPLIAFILLHEGKKIRLPKLKESVIFTFLFIIPSLIWYLYGRHATDPALKGQEFAMFLIGDLSRFTSANYYIKPLLVFFGYIFCGIGSIFFILGLWRLRLAEAILLFGIPFYFIIVPTAAQQHHYLYAITPIFAFFMAKGCLTLYKYCAQRKQFWVFYVSAIVFLLGFLISTAYILRHDTVMLRAANSLRAISKPQDIILSMNMNSRSCGTGGDNTSMFYLSQRKGWNVAPNISNHNYIEEQIEPLRENNARWLVITWYTPEAEHWLSNMIPKRFSRDPGVNGKNVFDNLRGHYKTIYQAKNYAIMDLNEK